MKYLRLSCLPICYHFGFYLLILFSGSLQAQQYQCPEELFPVYDKTTRQYGYVNMIGEWKVPAAFMKAGFFKDRYAIVMQGSRFGILNCEGSLAVAPVWDQIKDFYDGVGWVLKSNLWGLVNDKDQILQPPAYTNVIDIGVRGQNSWVQKDNLWGLVIKNNGRFLVNPQFESLKNLSDSIALVRKGAVFSVLNNYTGAPLYANLSRAFPVLPNLLAIKTKGKWGAISMRGSLKIKIAFDSLFALGGESVCYVLKGKIGFMSLSGRPLSGPLYDSLSLASKDVIRVWTSDLAGYNTLTGKLILPLMYDYNQPIINNLAIIGKKSLRGIYNFELGKWAQPIEDVRIYPNPKQHFFVLVRKGKHSFLNPKGTYTINYLSYDSIAWADTSKQVRVWSKGKIGFFDVPKAKSITEFSFDDAAAFQSGFAAVRIGKGYGICDAAGRLVIPAKQENIEVLGLAPQAIFVFEKSGKKGLIDVKKQQIADPEYDWFYLMSPTEILFSKSGLFGVINNKGEQLVGPKYQNMLISDTLPKYPIIVSKKGKYALLLAGGKLVQDNGYNQIRYLGNGIYGLEKDNKVFLSDNQGNLIGSEPYEQINKFNSERAAFRQNGLWGFVSTKGKPIIKPVFEQVHAFVGNSAFVQQKGLWGIIDLGGGWLVPAQYPRLEGQGANRRLLK